MSPRRERRWARAPADRRATRATSRFRSGRRSRQAPRCLRSVHLSHRLARHALLRAAAEPAVIPQELGDRERRVAMHGMAHRDSRVRLGGRRQRQRRRRREMQERARPVQPAFIRQPGRQTLDSHRSVLRRRIDHATGYQKRNPFPEQSLSQESRQGYGVRPGAALNPRPHDVDHQSPRRGYTTAPSLGVTHPRSGAGEGAPTRVSGSRGGRSTTRDGLLPTPGTARTRRSACPSLLRRPRHGRARGRCVRRRSSRHGTRG